MNCNQTKRVLCLFLITLLLGCGVARSQFADPGVNAIDPIAKRSAFPEANESIDKPLAVKRLSDEDQFAPAIDPADIPAIVAWDQAGKYVGNIITVEGRIVSVGKSNDGKVNFLNFHQDYRGKFYLVVFDDLAKTLDKPVAELFKDQLIRVKGKVETHRGSPQIKVESMDQVEFVDQ